MNTLTRRDYLKLSGSAGLALALNPSFAFGQNNAGLITRTIPGTDESLPVIGLGSSASFSRMAGENTAGIRAVLEAFAEHGGRVFDTAPAYGQAEEVAATIAKDSGLNNTLFWATKLNVAARGGSADPAAARAQIERSLALLGKPQMDLIQVHNLGDVPTQLPILQAYREAGKVRYIGVTTTFEGQYAELERIMRTEAINFIGVDYAIDNRTMEERIFPLAQERGIGVLVYAPFGRTRLWQKVEGHTLPDWAGEYGIASWGQFFLKFAISHPAITVATPATSQPKNVIDNLGAGIGLVPDEAIRQRMIAHLESL